MMNYARHDVNTSTWDQTLAFFIDGPGRFIKVPPSEKIEWSEKTETRVREPSTKISVVLQDTFTTALVMLEEGLNPLVLNMANSINPGGGVYKGSVAQEEDLFRRSNYFLAANVDFYPLKDLETLYSPSVVAYLDDKLLPLECVKSLSCIACAAFRDPKTIPNPDNPDNPADRLYESDEVAEITKKKIETIFQVALKKGHDSLVLGSLGCGAFNNPQMRIIEYFNLAIRKYGQYFKNITFAVLSKRDPNYDLFLEFIEDLAPSVPSSSDDGDDKDNGEK
jgi:uncharacterized protein (TIGR02452 family)